MMCVGDEEGLCFGRRGECDALNGVRIKEGEGGERVVGSVGVVELVCLCVGWCYWLV